MTRELVSALQVALTLVGTVVGAGFASGQEILRFFVVYGKCGAAGLFVSGICFVLLSHLILVSAARRKVYSHKDLVQEVVPSWVGRVYDSLLAFLLLVSTSIMLAGSGAVFRQQFGCHELLGIGFMVILVLLGSLHTRTVVGLNVALVPFLIFGLFFLFIQTTATSTVTSHELMFWSGPLLPTSRSWFGAAILYACYNMFLALSGLSSIGGGVSIRVGQLGAVLGAGIVIMLLTTSALVLWKAGSGILAYPVPLLAEAFRVNQLFGVTYSLVILAAMLTTAVVNVYGLARRIEEACHWPHWLAVGTVVVGAVPLAYVGFAEVISVAYPLIGYGAIGFFLCWIVHAGARFLVRLFRSTQ